MKEEPRSYDAVLGGNSLGKGHAAAEAKLRIEGAAKEEIDKIVEALKLGFEVSEESRDYPNRNSAGIRRYLRVKVK